MSGSQKFIALNRAPRVQIEYDVELYGAQKKVQLPFVMGVMSDLAGKSEQPPVSDRKFVEIDVDNFDERMRAMAPRASFTVPNTLTGEGNLAVDLTFEKMEDFSPQAIAAKIDTLAPLLEARRQLADLMAYMDGKSRAETLIENLLTAPALMQALAGEVTDSTDMDAALASLKARMPDLPEEDDSTARTLAGLAAQAPADEPSGPTADDILGGIERREAAAEEDRSDDVLAGIERRELVEETDRTGAVLASVERREEVEETDNTADVLSGIERKADEAPQDDTSGVLAGIERRDAAPEDDKTDDVLAGLERKADEADLDDSANVLAGIERREDAAMSDDTPDVLAGIERREEPPENDATDDILASLEPVASGQEDDTGLDDILAGLDSADEPHEDEDATDDVLAELKDHDPATEEPDRTDDILAGLDTPQPDDQPDDDLGDILAALDTAEPSSPGTAEGPPGDLEADADALEESGEDLDEFLADLDFQDADATGDQAEQSSEPADDLDALLADLEGSEDATDAGESDGEPAAADDDLAALMAGLDTADATDAEDLSDKATDNAGGEAPNDEAADDLDALLADLGPVHEPDTDADTGDGTQGAAGTVGGESGDDLDALLADLGGVDEPGEDAEKNEGTEDYVGKPSGTGAGDDLDALLADLGADDVADAQPDEGEAPADPAGDLDDLLADLGAAEVGEDSAADDLDALLADLTGDDGAEAMPGESADADLDALLADMGASDPSTETAEAPGTGGAATAAATPDQAPFGTISAPQPEPESMNRNRFRMAVFGDFTGRAARGLMETGDALAGRRPILLDVDTVEDVIEGFATTLTLPVGKDGAGIEVKLGGLDDLHPDELYEKVEIFDAIAGLRQQLGVGSMAGKATERLKAWAEEFGTPVTLPKRSAATSVPPDLKLSDFQALIGDTRGTLTKPTPADELIARIVGPHVVKGPDAGAAEMLKAVDEALSAAMRLVLHHPDFQAVESQWRSLDLLARRIETDTSLQIVLYDVSAEELAADLSAHEDLAQSGLYRLLTGVMDPEDGDGGFSALFGLYTFEETPPHAELLARIGLVAAHVDAPFFAAISPAYLETPKDERHKLVARAWDTLRAAPQAAYLGLASPRFLLRQPYGAKSDPIYEFEFEEFTPREGLKGLLWANPVVLVAILLAATYRKDDKAMNLGSVMSLGDIPFTFVTDRHGDQVALPCTERNLTSEPAQATLARGYMPVVWVKGRNEIRLGSFRSLADKEIAGPWSDAPPARPAPRDPTLEMDIAAAGATGAATEETLADTDGLPDTGNGAEPDDDLDLLGSDDEDDGQSLDDLLASFADDDEAAADDDDMDPELAALLEGL